jgi:hypothetical protein
MLVATHRAGTGKEPYQWKAMQLVELVERWWWRIPAWYKERLCADFNCSSGSPSCYVVQLRIKECAMQLSELIAKHITQIPTISMSKKDAMAKLEQRWNTLNAQWAEKQMMLGFLTSTHCLSKSNHVSSMFYDYVTAVYLSRMPETVDKSMARN